MENFKELEQTHKHIAEAAIKEFGEDHEMTLVALLHDIGKINYYDKPVEERSYRKEDGDWTYPFHARSGAAHLNLFLDEEIRIQNCLNELSGILQTTLSRYTGARNLRSLLLQRELL